MRLRWYPRVVLRHFKCDAVITVLVTDKVDPAIPKVPNHILANLSK